MAYISYDPWRRIERARFPETDDKTVEESVATAWERFSEWSSTAVAGRCRLVAALGEVTLQRRELFARLMAEEMGKPVTQGLAEADKCALLCRWYSENAPRLLEPERRPSSAAESVVVHEPQGVILGIMPWNFPFWQVYRFMVPAMAGGNAALLKHASSVPRCAQAIEEAVMEAGFPEGLFRNLFPTHDQVEQLIADSRIRGVSLTGSTGAGRRIAAVAGRELKKMVMELGGSDPFIVFADADVDAAVRAALFSRFQNNGQSCIAAKRMIIHEDIYDRFREAFTAGASGLRTGDPLDPATEVGPMVNAAAADELAGQLERTLAAGARLLCGGLKGSGHPALFMPAVVEQVPLQSPLAREETFGPVAPLFRFRSAEEAIRLANGTPFGLGASLWTAGEEKAMELARQIDTGTVAVNGFVRSEPGLPFGGVKESGYGRELSTEGLYEFLNTKTISRFRP